MPEYLQYHFAMHIGGKKPRYIVDLLFEEGTKIDNFEPDDWHDELKNKGISTRQLERLTAISRAIILKA